MPKTSFFQRLKKNNIEKKVRIFLDDVNSRYFFYDYYISLKDKDKTIVTEILEEEIINNPKKIDLASPQHGIKNPFKVNVLRLANVDFKSNEFDSYEKTDYLNSLLNIASNDELSELLIYFLDNPDEEFDASFYRALFKYATENRYKEIIKKEHVESYVKHGIKLLDQYEAIKYPEVINNKDICISGLDEIPDDILEKHQDNVIQKKKVKSKDVNEYK